MRILITGSRDWDDGGEIRRAIVAAAGPAVHRTQITVVHGGCRGADQIAGSVARGLGMTVEVHPAEWNSHGIRAGYIRNRKMVDLGASVCLAFILNGSKGATMCADLAEKAGIRTIRYERESPAA